MLENRVKEFEREKRIGTMISMQSTLHILEKHFPKEIVIEDVDLKWLKKFEEYLGRTRKQATVLIHMRNIRTVMSIAIKQGHIPKNNYPFGRGGYRFKQIYGRKRALTPEQIKTLVDFKTRSKELPKFRDLWLFMYLCNGITVDDLIMLKYGNIYDGEIYFIRGKTKRITAEVKEIRAAITPEMQTIINRWGNKFHPDSYIFPTIRHTVNAKTLIFRKNSITKVFNQRLEIIGALLKIDNFTTVTARHSYATILKRNGVSISFISESLGHKNINTTEHYLAQFEKEERKKNSVHLLNFPH